MLIHVSTVMCLNINHTDRVFRSLNKYTYSSRLRSDKVCGGLARYIQSSLPFLPQQACEENLPTHRLVRILVPPTRITTSSSPLICDWLRVYTWRISWLDGSQVTLFIVTSLGNNRKALFMLNSLHGWLFNKQIKKQINQFTKSSTRKHVTHTWHMDRS